MRLRPSASGAEDTEFSVPQNGTKCRGLEEYIYTAAKWQMHKMAEFCGEQKSSASSGPSGTEFSVPKNGAKWRGATAEFCGEHLEASQKP